MGIVVAPYRSMDEDVVMLSIDDIIRTLNECQGRDWSLDDALAFVTDLTGYSEKELMRMMSKTEQR